MQHYRNLYDYLLENRELFKTFPEASGDWDEDKKEFIKIQQDLESALNIDVIDEEEFDND